MSVFDRRRLLVALLRLGGAVTVTAFVAMLLPVDWMAAAHRWLTVGEGPPIVAFGTVILLLSRPRAG